MSSRATLLAVVLGAGAVSAAFFVSATLDVPMIWFDPVTHALHAGHRPSSVAIDWYSRTALSLLVGLAFFAVTRALARRRPPTPEGLRLAVGWALAMFVLCAGFYAYGLWGRTSPPEPLPPWYQPR